MAQVIPRKDAILVGLEARVVPPHPVPWIPITPATAHVAFQQALQELPASGGTLFVQPGSAPYVFGETVVVSRPDVVLRFASGPRDTGETSFLTFPAGGGPKELFKVVAPRFRCHDAYVKYAATNDQGTGTSDDDRSVFLVTDELGNADDAAFLDGTFDVQQATPGDSPSILNFSCIRADGVSEATPIRGLRVGGATFVVREGTRQSQAWSHVGPLGICGVRARNTAEVRVTRSVCRGIQDSRRGNGGPFVFLDNCPASVLSDLVVRAINTGVEEADQPAGTIVRIATHGLEEGHRTVIARISFEVVNARYMIELLDGRHDAVAFGNFGRLIPACEAGVHFGGTSGRGLAASAMNFHNVSGLDSPIGSSRAFDIQESADVALWANTVLRYDEPQGFLRVGDEGCANVVTGDTLEATNF